MGLLLWGVLQVAHLVFVGRGLIVGLSSFRVLPDKAVEAITPHLLKEMPNTYTFTKGLAEYYLLREAPDLPLAIVRPSIVGAAWREPIPGWVSLEHLMLAFAPPDQMLDLYADF